MRKNARKQTVHPELLEELRLYTNAYFISDLQYTPYFFKAACCLAAVPVNRYSLNEWNSAVAYLLKDLEPCTDPSIAKQKFVDIVQSRKRTI
ncbi:MAG TPA: hypothetical protein PLP25_04730 [Candidatus Limiplasma sp.]|nr:hypothetical protein [Candidatus Limiplasma sp.]HPS81148.1 hypothetical protein [Candidatus Limiplasma sp.]